MKTGMRLFSLIMAIAVVLMGTVSCSTPGTPPPSTDDQGEAKYHWRLYQGTPPKEGIRQLAAENFVSKVESASNGRIEIDIYMGTTLGDWTTANEMVQSGALDLALENYYAALDRTFEVQFVNYLFSDWAGARAAFMGPDDWMTPIIQPALDRVGFKHLGAINPGFVGIGFKKGVRVDPTSADAWFADAARTKIRCEPAALMERVSEAMGFKVQVMPYAEVYTAIQTGVVDGWLGGALPDSTMWADILDYFVQTRNRIDCENLFMNLALFQSLSANDQAMIVDAANEMQVWAWAEAERMELEWVAEAEAAGFTVVELAPEVKAEIARRSQETEWAYAEQLVGKEIMEAVRKQVR